MLKKEVAGKISEFITPMTGCRIVEIGTGWGESANFFSLLKPNWKIYTIDAFGLYGDGRIYSEWSHSKMQKLNKSLGKNVIQILGDSACIPWELPIDVLFIDGNHTFEGCSLDFTNYNHWVVPGGIIIFDDYNQENNPANGVKRVVQKIVSFHPELEMIYEGYYCAIFKKLAK